MLPPPPEVIGHIDYSDMVAVDTGVVFLQQLAWTGAHALECIMSVYRTGRKRKRDFRYTIMSSLVDGDYRPVNAQLSLP